MVTNKPRAPFAPTMDTNLEARISALSVSQEMKDFILEISEDLKELESFYNITFSPTRVQTIGQYIIRRINELVERFYTTFDHMDQDGKTDYLLIFNFLNRQRRRLVAEWERIQELRALYAGWMDRLIGLCERRQKVAPMDGKDAAQTLTDAGKEIDKVSLKIKDKSFTLGGNKFGAYRAAQQLRELDSHMNEWYEFYKGYDPLFTWWTSKPWEDLRPRLSELASLLREKLVGIQPGDNDAIVGQPIGRDGIISEIQAEILPYSPEELIQIAEQEYKWCEKEAIKASQAMGFGHNWRKAQEQVKNMYVEPGQQTYLVHQLAQEAIDYVESNDMVTLPGIAKECWRTFMMKPEDQKVNPFFLGGPSIIVSYPTDTMSHEDKLMVMRGNNPAFSRSTVFHELLPGHHLQYHWMKRSKPHRQPFATPFWMEGWAFYWEMILWDRGFPGTPENKLGMLFWRMHRCARIVFSLKFHLGQMTPQECIDYLVEKVGHERATAEGEVRRSFNGDWSPMYQAGYMLGALQLYALRKEILGPGLMTEKQFHDQVMKENMMPIELLRALLKGEKLDQRYKSRWRFY